MNPEVQLELMLAFLTKEARNFSDRDLNFLVQHFEAIGTHEGATLAEVLDGELALRKIGRSTT